MAFLLWDASALSKRYGPERGTATVDALFTNADMVVTVLGYAETLSVLSRKRNRGSITASNFLAAKTMLRAEVLDDPTFLVMNLDDVAVLDGLRFIEGYSLNATDAAILSLFLRLSRSTAFRNHQPILVASDRRLLRAAEAEGLATLNPEDVSPEEAAALFAQM
jgi:predicted nucleic acid-binding protein